MKYRIKIVTFKNGRKTYEPQVKLRIGWGTLDHEGKYEFFLYGYGLNTREQALAHIDMHFEGNTKEQIIEFEYITK